MENRKKCAHLEKKSSIMKGEEKKRIEDGRIGNRSNSYALSSDYEMEISTSGAG